MFIRASVHVCGTHKDKGLQGGSLWRTVRKWRTILEKASPLKEYYLIIDSGSRMSNFLK